MSRVPHARELDMRATTRAAIAMAAGLALGVPQGAEAQSSDGWWQWALQGVAEKDRDRGSTTIGDVILGRDDDARSRRDRDRRDTRRGEARNRGDRAGGGPPFCRNGEGHPVHGRQWCRDRGFGGGSAVWNEGTLGDIILGSPRGTDRQRRGAVDQGGLIDVLGDVVFRRLDGERRRLGGTAPLEGRWLQPRAGMQVLQIRSGRIPVAELTDVNGDGRVDYTLVPHPTR